MTAKRDEPIGSIKCPKCGGDARVLQFAERTKVDPAQDGGRSYPRKLYIDCPQLDEDDERCGVTRMDSKAGQAWILKNATMPPGGKKPANSSSSSSSKPKPSPAAASRSAASADSRGTVVDPPPAPAKDPPRDPQPKKKSSWFGDLI